MSTTHTQHPEACSTSPSGFHEYNTHLECRYCPHVMHSDIEAEFWRRCEAIERRRDRILLAVIAVISAAAILALVIGATP